MTLKTRKPTGAVPWPLVLIEGEEKAGKTWACAEFTASPKVGRCFWIDLGEGAADEYGAIPGADYEVVEHDGGWAYKVGDVFSEPFASHADATAAAKRAPFTSRMISASPWAVRSGFQRCIAAATKHFSSFRTRVSATV